MFRQAASGGKYYDIMVMDYVWLKLMVVVVRGGRWWWTLVDGAMTILAGDRMTKYFGGRR